MNQSHTQTHSNHATPSRKIRARLVGILGICGWLIYGNCWAQSSSAESSTGAGEQTSAAPAEQVSETSGPASSRNPSELMLLAQAMGDQSQWLETSHGKILTFYRPTEAKVTKGALLLLHAAEDPMTWPPELETLRRKLPSYGWETMAVSLPSKTLDQVPPRAVASSSASASEETATSDANSAESSSASSESSVSSSESASSESVSSEQSSSSQESTQPQASREELIKAYLLAAIGFLNQQGQYNLVVLVDNSSLYWSLKLLSPQIKANQADPKTVDGPLQALIVINLQAQEPLTKGELESSFNQPQLPVLDLFFAPESEDQLEQRELHKAVAMRNKLNNYQQLLIEPLPQAMERKNNFLLQRIRGFMTQNAQGKEIKRDE